MGAALLSLLLLADPADQEFLLQRLEALGARYKASARQQSPTAVRTRRAVVREVAHLPFDGAARTEAGKLLARIVAEDRAYRVRAETARAIGRIGTAPALRYPARVIRPAGCAAGERAAFTVFGPTCSSADVLPCSLELPADIKELSLIHAWLAGCPELRDLPGEEALMVESAVYEVCANIVEHGYGQDESKGLDLW